MAKRHSLKHLNPHAFDPFEHNRIGLVAQQAATNMRVMINTLKEQTR